MKVWDCFQRASLEAIQKEKIVTRNATLGFPAWFGETFAGVTNFACSIKRNGCQNTPQPKAIVNWLQGINHPARDIEGSAQLICLSKYWMDTFFNFWAQISVSQTPTPSLLSTISNVQQSDLSPIQSISEATLPLIAEVVTPHTSKAEAIRCIW